MHVLGLALASLLIFCLAALAYPFLVYPALLRALSRMAVRQDRDFAPSASLLFCAFNEGAVIASKIANLEAIKAVHPHIDILAFDDGSTDDTATLLGARPDLLRLVRGGGRAGKAAGMKRLAAAATGEILIFTDANVLLTPGSVQALLGYYADPDVGGVLGSLHYIGAGESATASVGSLYWRMEERLKDLESRSGNVMGADGSIFSIRRDIYPEFPDTVLDDLTVSMAVVFAGKRLIKAKDVIAHEQLVAGRGDEYRRKVRISARAWHTHCYLRPQLRRMALVDRFKYASRKIVRWFGGVFIVVGALAASALALRLSPWLLSAMWGISLLALMTGVRMKSGPLAAITDIVLAYFATLQGVAQAMRGKTFMVWNPAKSR